jgi:hypothetical protein
MGYFHSPDLSDNPVLSECQPSRVHLDKYNDPEKGEEKHDREGGVRD